MTERRVEGDFLRFVFQLAGHGRPQEERKRGEVTFGTWQRIVLHWGCSSRESKPHNLYRAFGEYLESISLVFKHIRWKTDIQQATRVK